MKGILIHLIKGYQLTFGLLFPRVCRFAPTCSNYSIEALQVHGVVKGSILIIWRILRCNPFCSGGIDPVPPKECTLMDRLGVRNYAGRVEDD